MRLERARPFWFLAVLAVFFTLQGMATAQTSQPATGAAKEEAAASTPGLADLVLKVADLSERLTDLEESLEEAFDPAAAESMFSRVEKRLGDLSSRVEELQITKSVSYDQLIQLKMALRTERDSLKQSLEPITAKLRRVAAWRREWLQEKKQWAQWQASLDEDMQLVVVQSTFARAQETISTARAATSRHLEPLLAAEQRGGDLRARIYSLVAEVDDLISDRREIVSSGSSPPMFASRYFAQFGLGVWYELRRGVRAIAWPDRQFFVRQWRVILLQVLLAFALASGTLRYRQSLEESERLRSFAKRPFALGLTVSLIITSILYTSVPSAWNLILSIVAWVAVARLAAPFITRSSKMWFIYGVALTATTIKLLRVLNLPLPLFRLYVFVVAVAGLSVCLWLARQGSRRGDSLLYTWGLWLGSVVFMVVALAEVSGYADFAMGLLEASFRTFGIGLAVWLFMLLTQGGVDWAVHSAPFQRISVFRNHGSGIATQSALLINLLIGSFFVVGILTSWRVYDRPIEA